jgi:hypothetical protein
MSNETTAPFHPPPMPRRNPVRALDENTPLTIKLGVLGSLVALVFGLAMAWGNVRNDLSNAQAALVKIELRADKAEEVAREMRDRLIRIESKLDNLNR